MLSIPGRPTHICEGLTRREWLRVGSLGTVAGGLTLPALLDGRAQAQGTASPRGYGKAKRCIVLFMFGAPAHQDTFDMKPEGPSDVRGEFKPISTSVPGIQVCEHLPKLATLTDRFAQIRSVTHPDNTHTVAMHYMLSGVRHARPNTNPQNEHDDFPCFGAVMNYVGRNAIPSEENGRNSIPSYGLPAAVSLNSPANQVSANNHIFPGFFAGFLGGRYDPLFVPQRPDKDDFQPFPSLAGPRELIERRALLKQLDDLTARVDAAASVKDFSRYHDEAWKLVTSAEARQAFDVKTEESAMRERYGMTPFGQGCLLARRLVEAGVSLVTVNWERDDAYWDTHADNFAKHKDPLLPNLDRGFSALLEDLQQRGLLEETLIVWLAEFGRTPKINAAAGRDHWAACNTVLLAGAGVPGGAVHGASDRSAAYPTRDPVGPEDLTATIYHLLGVDPHTTLRTPDGRPVALCTGKVIESMLG